MKKDAQFQNALAEVIEAVMFEHWVRFYFLKEEDGQLMVRVPEEAQDWVQKHFEHLTSLLVMVNDREASVEGSHTAVASFVAARIDGTRYPVNMAEFIFNSKEYKIGNYVLGLWLQGHEAYLEDGFHDFSEWKEMHANWLEMDQVKEYLYKLSAGTDAEGKGPSSTH